MLKKLKKARSTLPTPDYVFAVSEIQGTVYLSVTSGYVWGKFRESQRFFQPEEREALQQQLRFLGFKPYDHVLFSSTGGLTPVQVVDLLEETGCFIHDPEYVQRVHAICLDPMETALEDRESGAQDLEWQQGAVPI